MSVLPEVLAANDSYATGFDKGSLPMPPGRRFAILTCMDARLDPERDFQAPGQVAAACGGGEILLAPTQRLALPS